MERGRRIPRRGLGVASVMLALAVAGPAQAAEPEPEFWSLLGVGQGETTNSLELGQSLATGEPPSSFVNQRDLFNALLYEAPAVETSELSSFFKPADLGIAPGAPASETMPRPGVRVVRDATYGVPRVYGETRDDVMWGSGWVAAEDRLFFMEVLRYAARGKLTELVGPGPDGETLAADAAQLQVTDYTESELQAMLDGVRGAGAEGAQAGADLDSYVAGVNAYIEAARTNPALLPGEYAALGRMPEPWKATDSVAIDGLLNGFFGIGGGAGVEVAEVVQAARDRFGSKRGRRVVADFRNREVADAPVTTTKRFPFDDPGRPRRRAVALPNAESIVVDDPVGEVPPGDPAAEMAAPDWLRSLREGGLGLTPPASNAIAIPGARTESGHPLLVAGPQVDFYSPGIFYEVELHGPGIESRGVNVPGAGPYVLIGHGPDYAWSITTAQGDNTDVFAERLCEPSGGEPSLESKGYLYRGECLSLFVQDRELTYMPPPTEPGPPQTYNLQIERSVHGPIIARGEVRGKPVAFSLARASYMHDADIATGFSRLNDPSAIDGPRDFQRAAATVTGSFNFLYVDRRQAAYIQSGSYPRRARGTHPDLPNWGTGRWDWRGFDPTSYSARYLRFGRLPKDTDPRRGYLISWNNKQAPGWRASDADWQYGSVHRSERLEDRVRQALGRGKLSLGEVVGIMGDAATVDLRGQEVYPWLRRVIGEPGGKLGEALRLLDAWRKDGAHRRDLDRDGVYEDSAAVALMDAWWEPMTERIFRPVLGPRLMAEIADINQVDYTPRQGPDTWFYGWMSYVERDMRSVLGRSVGEPPSRVYCGRGSPARCRRALRSSLAAAIRVVEERYGSLAAAAVPATCPVTDPPTCDQLDFIPAGGVETPPIPWQDRGTFQQAVEIR